MSVTLANDDNFSQLLAEHPKVVVKYYADWCGTCRLMAPKFKQLSDLEEYQSVFFLDVNAEHSPQARNAAGVSNLPFYATFTNGQLAEGDTTAKIESVQAMIDKIK
jgi:thioredoxin 1